MFGAAQIINHKNESWGGAGGGGTAMNEPGNVGMGPHLHIEVRAIFLSRSQHREDVPLVTFLNLFYFNSKTFLWVPLMPAWAGDMPTNNV